MNDKKHKTISGLSVFVESIDIFMRFPSLMIYGLISMILTIICFTGMVFLMICSTEVAIDMVSSWLGIENWGSIIRWITYVGLAVGFFFFFIFSFVAVAGIVSIPFMDMLSAGIEKRMRPHNEEAPFWLGVKRGMASSTIIMLRMLLIMTLSLPLLLIPVLGTVVYFLINAWYAGFGFLDLPMGRRGWTYRQKCNFLKGTAKTRLVFGCIIYAMTMIPLLNLLIIPWASAAGTLLFFKLNDKMEL